MNDTALKYSSKITRSEFESTIDQLLNIVHHQSCQLITWPRALWLYKHSGLDGGDRKPGAPTLLNSFLWSTMHFISCASITHTPTALHIRTITGIGAPQAVLHNDMSVFVHRELLMLKRQWDEVMVVRKVGWNFMNAGHYSSSSSTSDKKINGEDFLIIFTSECTFMLRDLLNWDSLRWKDTETQAPSDLASIFP